MGGDRVTFNLQTFQDPLMTIYCGGCERLWAADFEDPTCECDPFQFNLDIYDLFSFNDFLSYYYDGVLARPWTLQLLPFWAYLMYVCPKWIDFP